MRRIIYLLLGVVSISAGQSASLPYYENFDSVAPPFLPVGWTTTTNRTVAGDFTTVTTTVRSSPNCVSSTNGKISQSLTSPVFNVVGKFVDSLFFYERRTSTHLSGVIVEASINGDTTFSLRVSDTLTFINSTSYVKRSIALPETLHGISSVQFRWRVLADTASGASGVIRFDDISITVKKAVDLAATSLLVSPSAPKKGETLTATIGITNRALAGNFSGTVQLFDSLTLIASQPFSQSLHPNDSFTVVVNYVGISGGRHLLTAKVIVSGDEDTTNNTVSSVVNAGYQPRTLLINEIMYAPPVGMPEWIELVNNSADTIPVSGWRISDGGTTRAALQPQHKSIPPASYVVVTTDTNAFKSYYPTNAPLFYAQFSALNNSGDAVVVFDPTLGVIDSLTFASSWGGASGGKSLERVDTAVVSTLQSNWKTSVHSLGATPGMINSVTQKPYDAATGHVSTSPLFPVAGDSVTIFATIKNIGKQNLSSATMQLYLDANRDSILTSSELQFQQHIGTVPVNDSVVTAIQLAPLAQGTHWLFVKILSSQDDDTTNNVMFFSLVVGIPHHSIVINEIMYAPSGDMPEWIEVFNRTAQTLSLAGWKVSDAGTTRAPLQHPQPFIQPNSFAIITTDTTIFRSYFPNTHPVYEAKFSSLNNTSADAVVFFDERGAVMDSVYYKPTWGGTNGLSLQRYDIEGNSTDSANWKSLEPTPGTTNNSVRKNIDVAVRRVEIAPSFPVVNQTLTVNATLLNVGRQLVNNIAVEFYLDANNDSVLTSNELKTQQVVASLAALDSVVVTAQFTVEQAGQQRIVAKIILTTDEEMTNNSAAVLLNVGTQPQSIVITEIMYNPQNDMPEWIELYNRSTSAISIAGWKIADNGTTRTLITNSATPIAPQSYAVVAADSSFTNFYSIPSLLFIARFSTLNNTTPDAVVLFDNQHRMIDSMYYKPSWGGANGQSLQRFDVFGASTDSTNWRTALPSPGDENVVARKNVDLEVKSISSAKNANGTRLQTTIINTGRQPAASVSVRIYHDANNDSIAQTSEVLHSTNISSIAPLDSSVVQFDWIHSLQGKQQVIVTIDYPPDERTSNNTALHTVVHGFAPQSLVINEIMYEPLSGNAEFVELLNRSSDTIDIADWKLTGSRMSITLSAQPQRIPPHDFVLVASDSSIVVQFPFLTGAVIVNSSLSLNNSGADLQLVDVAETQIDSVHYLPSWHLKNISTAGRSLERINPHGNSTDVRNWSSSVAKSGATPAQTNSIYLAASISSSGMTLSPNPFSPDGDGFEDFLSINYSLPTHSATIRVRIYDVTGRLVRRLAQNEPSPSSGSIIWNGLDDEGHRVRIGMYIVLLEAFDNFGGTVKTMKDVAVVAKKL